MKRIVFFIITVLFYRYSMLYCQVKEPVLPQVPVINSDITSGTFIVKVRITIQGRSGLTDGEIILNSEDITTPDKKNINLNNISRINVLLWEKRSRAGRYVFYPSRYEFLFRDNRKIVIDGNIEILNRIKINSKKAGYVYLYYYDYYKNKKWINTGNPEFNALTTKSAEGCAVSVELIQ